MNSYLGLVAVYAKVHKKKNRLTLICIVLSVMLVTAVFGLVDMSLRAQIEETVRRNGNWHIAIPGLGVSDGLLSDEAAAAIRHSRDVSVSDWIGIVDGIDRAGLTPLDTIFYQGKELVVQGSGEEMAREMNLAVTEGRFPVTAQEALLDRLGLEAFGLSLGDTIAVPFPDGQVRHYTIIGTYSDFSRIKKDDIHGLFLSPDGLRALPADLYREFYYIQFKKGVNIRQMIADIQTKYGLCDEQINSNATLLGLLGQSDEPVMENMYFTAAILFVLVALAGTCMIASAFNMSVLERTQFFGLLRCLGATKKQVRRYIRREGLRYCRQAVPLGLLAGCAVTAAAVFVLNKLNLEYLPVMSGFPLSLPAVIAGTALGLLVVMLASASPAKRAAKVSPQAAVTGNIGRLQWQTAKRAANTRLLRVDTAMGLHHAFANQKSMLLIGGSFATSIILFLCFSVLVSFMNHAVNPLQPGTPDLAVVSADEEALLPAGLLDRLRELTGEEPGIDTLYARKHLAGIPAHKGKPSGQTEPPAQTATLISYDAQQFEWAKRVLNEGQIDSVQNGGDVLVHYGYTQANDWRVGEALTLNANGRAHEITIAGIVSNVPVRPGNDEWIVVCSEETFTALTGITGHRVIEMQINGDISNQVRTLLPPGTSLRDYRQSNREIQAGYYAMAVFVYGFLIVIALVALGNIVNTVNASVSSRMNHYGVMRAVGMSGRQLKKVIMAEAAAYAVTGSIAGGVSGLFLHRFFFNLLVTEKWGEAWQSPVLVLSVIILASLLTTLAAIIAPAGKIKEMSIINVVNAQ